MTTKNINGREVVFVEVPDGMLLFKISGTNHICYKKFFGDEWETDTANKLPEGKFKIVGQPLVMSEEQWAGIVEKCVNSNHYADYEHYSPTTPFSSYFKAYGSGLSLLSSLGMKPGTTLILIKEK